MATKYESDESFRSITFSDREMLPVLVELIKWFSANEIHFSNLTYEYSGEFGHQITIYYVVK